MSDLLDYINPSNDAKGRDMAMKRRSHSTKVCCRFAGINNFDCIVGLLDFPITFGMSCLYSLGYFCFFTFANLFDNIAQYGFSII